MQQILATEAQKDFILVMNKAQQEPIIVKENDRNTVAIISMDDYEDLVRIKNHRLNPHFSQKVGSAPPEALQSLDFDRLLALEKKRQYVIRIQPKVIVN